MSFPVKITGILYHFYLSLTIFFVKNLKIYEGKRKEVGGVKPYNTLSMYKVIILQAWHSLSDPQLEENLRVYLNCFKSRFWRNRKSDF